MPLIRLGLTPFGLTYYLDNYLGYRAKTLLVSLNAGTSPFYTHYYGSLLGRTDEFLTYKNCTLDLETGLWY